MKTVFLLFLIVAIMKCAEGQVPQSLNYQAGIYNTAGMPIRDHSLDLRASVIDSSASGPIVYSENFSTSTDVNGLFSVNLGTGNPIIGDFDSIDWGNGSKWLQTEIDTGTGYILMGITQFLSVPYALYADKSKNNLAGFGIWESGLLPNTIYHAQTDGFVKTLITGSIQSWCVAANVISDSSATPTSIVGQWFDSQGEFTVPIRKNDYWKVTQGNCQTAISSIKWLPLR